MTPYKVPLTAKAQSFNISLAGVSYNLTLYWNRASNSWVIDIADVDNNMLCSAIPLVTGINLLGQLKYLGIGGRLMVQTDYNATAIPTLTNLGADSNLYFITG